MKQKKRLAWFCIIVLVALSACNSKKKPDPGTPDPALSSKPLEFFACSFHDEEGFTFDGFPLMADYGIMEKRMEVTETETGPWMTEQDQLPHNIEGKTKMVKYSQISIEQYPDAVGEVTYIFYEKQLIGGNMVIQFPDFERAKGFFEERGEALAGLDVSEDGAKLVEEDHASLHYVDKRNIHIDFKVRTLSDQKGEVALDFSENVNRYGMESQDSQYFDFKKKEK